MSRMADYAIIRTGGKQYLVEPGKTYTFEKLDGAAGDAVTFDEVLLTFAADGSAVAVGTPFVAGTTVAGTIVAQGRTRKLLVVKYKAKSRYRRKQGHRQHFTKVHIAQIGSGKRIEAPMPAAKQEAPVAEDAAPAEAEPVKPKAKKAPAKRPAKKKAA